MHCYHMAFKSFQNLDNLWKFCKGLENHSFLKWLKKACSARLYDTIKTAFYQKSSVISCRNIRNDEALTQTSFGPKFTCYSFRFHTELKTKKNKATMGNFL